MNEEKVSHSDYIENWGMADLIGSVIPLFVIPMSQVNTHACMKVFIWRTVITEMSLRDRSDTEGIASRTQPTRFEKINQNNYVKYIHFLIIT